MFLLEKIRKLSNIPRSIYYYKKNDLLLPYLPGGLWVEPTNKCNLKCIMCPSTIIPQEKFGFMDMNLYEKIILEAKNFISFIILCVSGEPLLHKNFSQMVKFAKDNGIDTYVSTNCTVLTPQISRELLEAGLGWINLSFDGCSKKIYEKVRVNANFEKSLQNVVDLLKIKKKIGAKTSVDLQILVMDEEGAKDYEENIDTFISNFSRLPLNNIQRRQPSSWGGFFSDTEKFKTKKLNGQYSPCSYLWSSLSVLWDGRVVACCSDFFGENVLGQFPDKSLKDIWNDKPMQRFRQAMINKKYMDFNKNCRSCDSLWDKKILGLPSGIRGNSVLAVNNIFGKNCLGMFKRFAKFLEPNFAMEIISKEKK